MKINTKDKQYRRYLKEESNLWNKTAKDELKKYPPDYSYYKTTFPYRVYRHLYVKRMVKYVN